MSDDIPEIEDCICGCSGLLTCQFTTDDRGDAVWHPLGVKIPGKECYFICCRSPICDMEGPAFIIDDEESQGKAVIHWNMMIESARPFVK